MKIEFRLMYDILANTITVKAGSFDTVTHERFLLMTAIHFGLKINWSKLLFNILKDMVTPAMKQAKGFAPQICALLKGAPDLTLGECKTFPPLKILTTKTVGTHVAKNKNITTKEEAAEPVEKIVKKAVANRRPSSAVSEPAAKKKRTTVGRAAPPEQNLAIVPVVIAETAEVEMMETDLEEEMVMKTTGTDPVETESSIDVSAITNYDEVISFKVLSNEEGPLVETEKEKEKENEKETIVKGKPDEKVTDSTDTEPLSKVLELTETATSDEESMSIDDILKQIPEEMMLPSTMAEEPTKINFGVSFRHCCQEQMLQWAETDSLQTAVQRRMYIIAKYREMLLRKFLEARRSNFVSGTPTSAIDLKILDLLSDAHRIALEKFMEQMNVNKLDGHDHLAPFCLVLIYIVVEFFRDSILTSSTGDLVAVGPVVDIEAEPTGFISVFRRGLDVDSCVERSISSSSNSTSSRSANPISSSSSSSIDSPTHFTGGDIPLTPYTDDVLLVEETTDVPSTDYTNAFAQLRATVDTISLEQVQTRFHIDELKTALSKKISNLETAFLTASDNQDRVILVPNNVLRKKMQVQNAALSKKLDDIRKEIQDQKAAIAHDFLEFRVESQKNFNTLSAHLSEIIAYINRGRDDKRGENSSSRGPQPPEDKSRPSGGGSRSAPTRKRGGGSHGGGGTSSRGFRYWLG
ncbi:hypothetical protein F511_26461 [Dorcoceras hygrometricum]|uniref:Splicing factor 3B subunit 1-like n=1 Tax=Dorcoceras hygrometricum TaxID=472368 RepID=A0A2Z7CUW8_9LAMI|nr:hypothetical protein F511_26461 [Dorcoceras hygrometricum]